MSGKVLFDGAEPKTQSFESVKAMLEFLTGEQVRELPAVVRLANGWQLIRSSKGDAYYMTSLRECSRPGYHYRRTCRHVKSLRDKEEARSILILDAYAWEPTPEEIQNQEMKAQEQQQPQKEEQLSPRQQLTKHIQEMIAAGEA